MITDGIKAEGIALLRAGETARDVSDMLEIPYMLVREWQEALDLNDLTILKANANALTKVVTGDILANSEQNRQMLQSKIEETAIDIVDAVRQNVHGIDPIQSKSLQLLAATCSILYKTLIDKGVDDDSNKSTSIKMIDHIGID